MKTRNRINKRLVIRMLQDEEIERIHLSTLDLLEQVGLYSDSEPIIEVFLKGGADDDLDEKIIKILRYIVEESIKKAPKQVKFFGRYSEYDLMVGGDDANFGMGGTPVPFVRDIETGEFRQSTKKDVEDAALSGINLIHDCGYLASGNVGSLEMVVICDEVISIVSRIVRGIDVNDETLAMDVMREVGPRGSFLSHGHTVKLFAEEILIPKLFDRKSVEEWTKAGKKEIGVGMPMFIEFPIKDRKSWEEYKKRLNPNDPRRYPKDWDRDVYIEVFENHQDGKTLLGFDGFYGFDAQLMGIPRFNIMFFKDPELMYDMVKYWEYFTRETIRDAVETLKDRIDMVFWWEDLAEKHGPCISPRIYKEEIRKQTFLAGNLDKRKQARGEEVMRKEVDSKVPVLKEMSGYIPRIDHSVHVEFTPQKFLEYAEYLKIFSFLKRGKRENEN